MATATEVELKSEEDAAQLVISTLDTIPAKIKSQDEYERYMAELAVAKQRVGKVEAFFLALRRPWLDAQKKNRDTETAMLKPLQDRYAKLKRICDDWFIAAKAEAERKQAEANKKHEQKVQAAIDKGKDPAAIAPPKTIESKAPTTIQAGGASITMKMDKHFKITESGITSRNLIDDPAKRLYRDDKGLQGVPDNCWQLNHTRLLEIIKAGVKVAGVEMIELPGNRLGK